MILGSPSPHLQKLVLGSQFLTWIQPGLIPAMCNPVARATAAHVLLLGLADTGEELLAKLTPKIAHFASSLLQLCLGRAEEGKLRIPGDRLVPLFDAIGGTTRSEIASLLVPLAAILSSPAALLDYDDFKFQYALRPVLEKLCHRAIASEEAGMYPVRVRALTFFTWDEAACTTMVKVAPFTLAVVKNLSSGDAMVLRMSWLFFEAITKFPRVTCDILGREQTSRPFTGIVNTDNNWILRKFLEFSIYAWTKLGPTAVTILCQAMSGGIGRISCIYKTRFVLFHDNPSLISVIEKYYMTITDLDAPGIDEFLDGLARHISQGEFAGRTRAQTRMRLRKEGSDPKLLSMPGG
jgi:hypothetical protein